MPTIASKRALSRAWYVNSYGFCREKSTQRDPFRKSTSWNKTRIHDVVRSFEPSFVSSFPPVSFFRLTSLFLSSLTPCTMILSLYLFPVSSPHSRSFLSLSKPLSTQRTCAFVYTSTRCPLFPTVIRFYENRRLLGRTEATTSLKVVLSIRHPSRFPCHSLSDLLCSSSLSAPGECHEFFFSLSRARAALLPVNVWRHRYRCHRTAWNGTKLVPL